MRFGSVNFLLDDSGVIVRLYKDGDSKQRTLAFIDLASPEIEILLPDGVGRQALLTYFNGWLDDTRFVYHSDETGYGNLYVYDRAERTSKALTAVEEEVWFDLLEIENRRLVSIVFLGCSPTVKIAEKEALRRARNLEGADQRIETFQAFLKAYPDSGERQYVFGRLFRENLSLGRVSAALGTVNLTRLVEKSPQ